MGPTYRPERPKVAKDEVKRPEGPPARSRGPEGPLATLLLAISLECHADISDISDVFDISKVQLSVWNGLDGSEFRALKQLKSLANFVRSKICDCKALFKLIHNLLIACCINESNKCSINPTDCSRFACVYQYMPGP